MNLSQTLYEHRLLVFLENDEGVFRQVLLNEDQFKKIFDAVVCHRADEKETDLRPGMEIVIVHEGDIEIPADTFIGMSSIEDDPCDCDSV